MAAAVPGRSARALQGDTVDAVIWRAAALGASALPAIFAANPGLAAAGPVLAEGQEVLIPDAALRPPPAPLIQLWD